MAAVLARGTLVDVDLSGDAVGTESGTAHPLIAVVVQSDRFGYGKTLLVVPLTTNLTMEASPFGVRVDPDPRIGLREPSVAMCWQVIAIDRRRARPRRTDVLAPHGMDLIAKTVALLAGLNP